MERLTSSSPDNTEELRESEEFADIDLPTVNTESDSDN